MRVTNATWLISDTHFGHKNIIKFQQRPASHEAWGTHFSSFETLREAKEWFS